MLAARVTSLFLFGVLWWFWVLRDSKDDWGPSCVHMHDMVDSLSIRDDRRQGEDDIVYYCSQLRGMLPYLCAIAFSSLSPLLIFQQSKIVPTFNRKWMMHNGALILAGVAVGLIADRLVSNKFVFAAVASLGVCSFPYAAGFAVAVKYAHAEVVSAIFVSALFSFTSSARLFAFAPVGIMLGLHWTEYVRGSDGDLDMLSKDCVVIASLTLGVLWMIHERTANKVHAWLGNFVSLYTFYWVWPSLKGPGVTYEQLPRLDEREEPTLLSDAFLAKESKVTTSFQLLVLCCYTIQRKNFWTCMLHGWFYLTCMTIDPILMHSLLASDRANLQRDILLGLGLSLSMLVRVSCMEVGFFYSVRTMVSARSALVVSIFKRALRRTSSTGRKRDAIDLPNLMAADADKIGASGWVIFFLASWTFAIMSLPIYLVVLAQYVGFGASFAGLSVLLVGGTLTRQIAMCARPMYKSLQEARDSRSHLLRSALASMLSIKMFADENRWLNLLEQARNKEMSIWLRVQYVHMFNGSFSSISSMSVPIVVFAWVTQVEKKPLDPAAAFTTLLIISQITWSVGTLPDIFALWSSLSPSAGRLLEFFREFDDEEPKERPPLNAEHVVQMSLGSAIGFDTALFVLREELIVKHGDFVLVTGRVGSGKSCLLSVLSGATKPLQGEVLLAPRRAYAEQKPFLLNGTVRENVLFGDEENKEELQKALQDAKLERDLLALPRKLETLVGDGGVQLSGGQRARVAFARALYLRSKTTLFVLDDLLASVDGETSRAIWDTTLLPLLDVEKKTVVLSSSFPSKEMLARCTLRIHITDEGQVQIERYSDVKSLMQGELGAISKTNSNDEHENEENKDEEESGVNMMELEEALTKTLKTKMGKTMTDQLVSDITDEMVGRTDDDDRDASNQAEIGGTLSSLDLKEYWSRFGLQRLSSPLVSQLGLAILIIISALLQILSPFWLAHWTETEQDGLLEYILIQLCQVAFAQMGFLLLTYCALGASFRLHATALKNLLLSPMSLFDSVPAGRLLNILSGDLRAIDEGVPNNGFQQIESTLVASMQIIVVAIFARTAFWIVPFLFLVYRFILNKVRGPSRDVKRIEAASNAPVYIGFLDALRGQKTIRAFNREFQFGVMHSARTKRMATARIANEAIAKWAQALAVQTGCLLYLFCAMVGIGTLYESNGEFSVAKLALLLTFAGILQRTGMELMMGWTSFESSLVSIERISSLLRLPTETEQSEKGNEALLPSGAFQVEFRAVRLRYRLYRPLVLKNATFILPPGSKAAIVGRSGGGKSSLFLALLRVYAISSGDILIGGVDVNKIPLSILRRSGKVRVVLQDAILPHPTLRGNIDPELSDFELRAVLRRVGLNTERFQTDLDLDVGPGGSLLSVGERQLVCVARVLTGDPKLLLCDECTSSVDEVVDDQVHRELLSMKDVTILSILHRRVHLNKFDYVLVVDDGRIVAIHKNQDFDLAQ